MTKTNLKMDNKYCSLDNNYCTMSRWASTPSLRRRSVTDVYNMDMLKDDLSTCRVSLNEAIQAKIDLETKMREVELKRKRAEEEYKSLYSQLNTKHVSWEAKPDYKCSDSIPMPNGYPCVNPCKPRRNSMCALEKLEKRGTSSYERILIPYHLHALDLVDVKDVYKDSWKCDNCFSEKHPSHSSWDTDASYPYHCYLCDYDVCQTCVDRMEGAIVTDHFTYFTH